jgi:hypothetical protein
MGDPDSPRINNNATPTSTTPAQTGSGGKHKDQ